MQHKVGFFTAISLTALLLLSTGCAKGMASGDDACPGSLDVSVWYRERIALLPGSTLTVRIEDVSKMDAKATVLMEQTVELGAAPPFTVHFDYDCASIDKKARYSVRARIERNGKLQFINTTSVDPFSGEPGKPVEVMVQRVAQ